MNFMTSADSSENQRYRGKQIMNRNFEVEESTTPKPKKLRKAKSSATKALKTTASRRRSEVHQYFVDIPGKSEYRQCITCGAEIKTNNGSTTGLRRHVASHDRNAIGASPRKKYKPSTPSGLRTGSDKVKREPGTSTKSSSKLSLSAPSKSFEESIVDSLISEKLFIQDLKKSGWKKYFDSSRTALKERNLNNLHSLVNMRYRKAREGIKKIFKNDTEVNSLSVFVDSWSTDVFKGYLSIGVQYLSSEFQLKKYILSYVQVLGPSTSEILAEKIFSVLKDFGVVKKVKLITGNNSGKISEAIAIVRNKILDEEDSVASGFPSPENFHIFCLGKILNSYSKEVLECFSPTLEKLRGFTLYWGSSKTLTDSWDTAVVWSIQENGALLSSLNMDHKKVESSSDLLPLPYIANDWFSVLQFVQKFVKNSNLILTTQSKARQNVVVPDSFLLEQEDLEVVKVILNLLEDLRLFVDISSKNYTVTLSSRKLGFDKLMKTIEDAEIKISDMNHGNIAKKFKQYLKDISNFLGNWKSTCEEDADSILSTLPFQLASLLDKRFPHSNLHSSKEWENNYQNLISYVQQMDYVPNFAASGSSTLELLQVAQQMQSTPQQNATEIVKEVTEFLDMNPINPRRNVLDWWKENMSMFPRLALAARQILSCPSTSCAEDPVFSHELQVDMDGQVARDETFTKRIELRSWLGL
eukprot:snap_masked-scaffold_5-processed-gene-4.24-mRNA-1 protein AED:1.00 eAED:1.00 QI:0/-1/0/0/-1/1/1/0/696